MKSKARITVYEHDRLTTDQASFKTRHLNALLKLNEYHNFDYFDPIPNGVKFKQYVGIIQVDGLSIEILPKSDKDFLNDCAQSANWLVKSLHQRATTIIKVASEIVLQQDAFFRFGVQHLKPLVLRDVAEAISMHESTISRVTNNKYISTPRGMLELKYFFTSSIASAGGGEAYSAEAVKFKIKSLIDEEVAGEILSDDKIVKIIREEGIDIARRTVAKYRESLEIPSSIIRRRIKNPIF